MLDRPAPRKIATVYMPSQRAEALELAVKNGVTAASKVLGMDRFSIYEWRRKVKLAATGKGNSPASAQTPPPGARPTVCGDPPDSSAVLGLCAALERPSIDRHADSDRRLLTLCGGAGG